LAFITGGEAAVAQPNEAIDLTAIGRDGRIQSFDTASHLLTIVGSGGTVTAQIDASDATNLTTRPDGVGGTELTIGQPAPRDFNGDGMSDILWQDAAGDVAIW